MARKKKPEEHVNHERWLVSYADFITLLFATFTAMFAISNADKTKFERLSLSLRYAFSTETPADVKKGPHLKGAALRDFEKSVGFLSLLKGGGDRGSGKAIDLFPESSQSGRGDSDGEFDPPGAEATSEESAAGAADGSEQSEGRFEDRQQGDGDGTGEKRWKVELETELRQLIVEDHLDQEIDIRSDPRGLVVSLRERAFFERESTDVRPESVHKLNKIVEVLMGEGRPIHIEGHTDTTEPSSGLFRTNWELSAMRASRLLQYMIKSYGFAPELLSAVGYGSVRPVASNDSALGREQNRRVDIVILESP